MNDAIIIAKALMSKGADRERANTKDGNMIINKLLYFAQLISLYKYEEKLFENDIYAFQEGCVVDDVRRKYVEHYNSMNAEAKLFDHNILTEKEKKVLDATLDLFGDFSAQELSEITHGHKSWIENYEGSKVGSYFHMDKQKINTESLIENEVCWISRFLEEQEEDDGYEFITNNGTVFYYEPSIFTEEEVKCITRDFKGIEDVYTVVKEDDGKAVIY